LSESGGENFARRLRTQVHAAWLAARDPRTPWHARALGLIVTAYALSPIDLIPISSQCWAARRCHSRPCRDLAVIRMVPPHLWEEHQAAARAAAARPRSRLGLAIVIAVWAAAVATAAWWLRLI
jgi:hypothetical protein